MMISTIGKTLVGFALASLLAGLAVGAPTPVLGQAKAVSAAQVEGLKVNLNTATEQELLRLPGIGPSKAQAILKLRQRIKRFRRIEDLMRVKGIGRKTFRKLRPMLQVEGATTLPSKKGRGSATKK